MTPELVIEYIKTLDKEKQLEIGHALSAYEWNYILPKNLKPDWWDKIPTGYYATPKHSQFVRPILNFIDTLHTKYEQLQYHNVRSKESSMTNEEFDVWFKKNLLYTND